jgi:dipeptidase
MRAIRTYLFVFLLVLPVNLTIGQPVRYHDGGQDHNCFSILVGRNASEDGAVLFAHMEDDFGKQLVNWYIKDAEFHHEGEQVTLKNGGLYPQVEKTAKVFWLEIPGMDFSDSYMNEYGVVLASNSCASREDDAEISEGGISYGLRRLMAERAQSAREAVEIGGALVERFGYTGSGRTYSIADSKEAWTMAVVKGKHWVAQRVPDNSVMVLPNNYTIEEIDLSDSDNFMASPDIIDYAIERGWYDPSRDGEFNFRNAYAAENSLSHPGNTSRAWGAYHLFNMPFGINDSFPYSFQPNEKVSKEKLMDIFAYHYEGTELDKSKLYTEGSPYELNGSMICGKASVYGFVAECRSWLPVAIGTVMWLAPQWPDIQPFTPWYCGINEIPDGFAKEGYLKDLSDHYNPPEDIHERYDGHAFWSYVRLSEWVNEDYAKRIKPLARSKEKIERKLLKRQYRNEKMIKRMYKKDPDAAINFLNEYTAVWAKISWKRADKYLKK